MEETFFKGLKQFLLKLTCRQPTTQDPYDRTYEKPIHCTSEASDQTNYSLRMRPVQNSTNEKVVPQTVPPALVSPVIPSTDKLFQIKNTTTDEEVTLNSPEKNFTSKLDQYLAEKDYERALEHFLGQKERIDSALWEAANRNEPHLCKLLLTKDFYGDLTAKVDYKGPGGLRALHIAAQNNDHTVCEVLLDYGDNTDLNPLDDFQRTPLHLACSHGGLETAQLLLRSGAGLNCVDLEGNTPLHYAVFSGNNELVNWVLSRSPNLKLCNKQGLAVRDLLSSEQDCDELSEEFIEIQEWRVSPFDFDPIQQIGKGSFGEVFLVQKSDNQQFYAMKILKKNRILGQNLANYAMTERNVLTYTRHPFIVALRFAFQTANKLFLILDYCPGGSLGAVIQREKRFPEPRAKLYLAELLLAIEYLHSLDIIYRDLKPDNVVLDEEGHALLTDFGLSKEGIVDHQSAITFCGSIAYVAPEVYSRHGHGKPVDWYLLGVLLYEMLVGTPPFIELRAHERRKLKVPTCLSSSCKSLLYGLLMTNPNKRLGTMRDAEEIKEHEFFSGVNWDSVYRRELKLPKTKNISIVGGVQLDRIVTKESLLDGVGKHHFAGWTFIETEDAITQ